MTHRRPLARLLLPLSAALAAALTASCGDPAPPAPVAHPVAGAPIAGAPIDGTTAPPTAPTAPTETTAPAPIPPPPPPSEPPVGVAEPSSPAAVPPPATPEIPPIGDVTTREERRPEDETVTTPPPGPAPTPSGLRPSAAAVPATAESPSPIPPTTASLADKPALPDREKPAGDGDAAAPADPAVPGAAPVDPKTGLKSFIPKDHKKDEPLVLTFEQLASYDYVPPPMPVNDPDTPAPDPAVLLEAARKQIPDEIWELEGKLLTVEGYMIPLEYQDDGVRSFILCRHAMGCCFGVMPRPHEMIDCALEDGKTTAYVGYIPVSVTGTFRVVLPTGTQTMLTGIYRMDAPKVTIPKER